MATVAATADVATKLAVTGAGSADHGFRCVLGGTAPADFIADAGTYTAATDAVFELKAGDTVTISWAFDSGTAATVPNTGDIACGLVVLDDNTATIVRDYGTVLALTTAWTKGRRTGSVTFVATGNGTSGAAKAGTYRLKVSMNYAQTTNDAVNGKYTSDSDGGYATTGTPNLWAGTAAASDKGYIRAGVDVTAIAYSDTLGGTTPSPFAWPNSQRTRMTVSASTLTSDGAVKAEIFTPTTSTTEVATGLRQTVNTSSSSTTWDDTAAVLLDARIGVTSTGFGLNRNNSAAVSAPANSALTGRPVIHYETVPSGWTLGANDGGVQTTKSVVIESSSNTSFTYDPRLTFASVTLAVDRGDGAGSISRTPGTFDATAASAVINYSVHTITSTFKLNNARGTALTSTDGANATLTLRLFDTAATAEEKTINASLNPDATGVYAPAAYTITGPAATVDRDAATGASQARANHTTSGRTKRLRADLNPANSPQDNDSSNYLAVSSLFRLDVHPQKSASLTRDTDPYATPGSAEDTQYVISADILSLFCFVGDVYGNAQPGVGIQTTIFDSAGSSQKTGTGTTTSSGANKGWMTTPTQIAVSAPSGNWNCRITVDLTAAGALGNYGDDNSGSIPFGSKEQLVGVSSAYTADRAVVIQIPDEITIGVAQAVRAEYINYDGAMLTPDAFPSLRVYALSATGVETIELAAATMTKIDTSTDPGKAWSRNWTPSAAGNYVVEVTMLVAGGKITAVERISVRPRFALKIGALTDRM